MSEEKKAESFASKAYAQAQRTLRERHREEFEEILTGIYVDANESRVIRLSKEEREALARAERIAKEMKKEAERKAKAQATLDALLSEFPDLQPTSEAVSLDDPAA